MPPKHKPKLSSLSKDTSPEKRLEAVLFALSLTRQEVAAKLDISLSSIAMYFNGYHSIRRVVALAFESCYGVRAEWLLHAKKPIYAETQKQRPILSEKAYEFAFIYDSLPKEGRENISLLMPRLKAYYKQKNKS